MTVSEAYECVVYCRSTASLRYEYSYCETVFLQIDQFGIALHVQFVLQKYGITKFGYSKVYYIIVKVLVVFFVKL